MSDATIINADCLAWMNAQPADSVDLIFGSPPYCDARTYGIGAQRDCIGWVEWMLDIVTAAARICRGAVFMVAAGVTRQRNYWPACEGLMWEWWKRGGEHQLYRPCVFHRVGIPGSGGEDYFRADWEYVMCFKRPGKLVWSDNTACGHAPKFAPGGACTNRGINGERANGRDKWGGTGHATSGEGRQANGERKTRRRLERGNEKGAIATQPVVANPGNVVHATYTASEVQAIIDAYESGDLSYIPVGGGLMGHELAHENEAPFPARLAEIFIRSFAPPGGTVLDPFSGSGTTCEVAKRFGRNGIGIDIRESQVELAKRRLSETQTELFA